MIRSILIFILTLLIYSALRTIFHSAVKAYRGEEERPKLRGEDMVLDPQCKTYVLKDRATSRRIRGKLTYFCSASCARQYEDSDRQ